MWYTNDNERILEFADHKFKDEAKYTQLCTMDEYINEPYKLVIVDGEAVLNPDYEQEKERRIAEIDTDKSLFFTGKTFFFNFQIRRPQNK